MKSYDVIIIGAGHNGMAASIKLAKTGRKVLILESSSEFGGMASSNILLDDNVNQPLPHLINHLCSKSIKDLDLIKYGLKTKKFFIHFKKSGTSNKNESCPLSLLISIKPSLYKIISRIKTLISADIELPIAIPT